MILSYMKKLLQIKSNDYSNDELLSTIIELTLAKVKSLCNIDDNDEVLEEFDFNLLMAQIAADIYTCYSPVSKKDDSEEESMQQMPEGEVKSLTIGDYKVEYNTASTSYTTHSLADSVTYNLDKYDEELARYRYLIFY